MMGKEKYNLDIIMLSKFSKRDGGRETWLYNFLPELLKNNAVENISIFGFRYNTEDDNTEILKQLDVSGQNRVHPFIGSSKRKTSKIILFFFSLFSSTKKINKHEPNFTIAVGGLIEVIYMLSFGRFKKGKTIAWLRTIYTYEKANRIPDFLIGTAKRIESWLLNKVDIIIVNGDDTKAFYKKYGLTINVIKNAINPVIWDMPIPRLDYKIKVAYIGRLSKVKGIESFIELTQRISISEFSEFFEFHIVGEANSYINQINELRLSNKIYYHGSINNEDLPEFLWDIDVCVALTFVSEKLGGAGLSNALLEQMAAGKVILAWNNNAFNQILNDKNAYVVEQYAILELENALIDVCLNRKGAQRKARQSKIDVQPYTIESHVNKFIEVLELY